MFAIPRSLLLASAGSLFFVQSEPPPRGLVERAVAQMGGITTMRAIRARTVRSNETVVLNYAQEDWRGAPKPLIARAVVEHQDWIGMRLHAARPLNANPTSGSEPARQTYLIATPQGGGLRADTIWLGAPADLVQGQRIAAFIESPDYVLRVALDSIAAVRSAGRRTYGGRAVSGVSVPVSGETVRVWFDDAQGLPVLIDWHPDAGDGLSGEVTVEFGFWATFGDQYLPRVRRFAIDGEVLRTTQVRTIENVPALDDSLFSVPSDRTAKLTIALKVTELATGVYRVSGATHSSVAVRQGNGFFLLEAPVSRRHTQAVLDTLRGRFPSVPVRRFLSSHFHGDHSNGATVLLDDGIEAWVPADQAEFYRRFGMKWDAPKSVRRLVEVSRAMTVGSGSSRVIVERIPTSHVWGLLVAFLPEHGILFEADLQNSGQATLKELRDFVIARGWAVRQMSGVHGPLVSWDAFLASIK